MKASALEFRFRFLIHAVIYVLGFTAPWNYALHLDTGSSWLLLAVYLARAGSTQGLLSLGGATVALLGAGIGCAVLGAWLRTWGATYLGPGVVADGRMQGAGVVADGPYRRLRNPLYLGTFVHTFALALLMPASGAVFSIVAIGVFQIRLILAEEEFLAARLGAPYLTYCSLVPRVVPAPRVRVAASGGRAAWGQAVLGEIYFWGVAGSFAIAGWRYNAALLMQCVVVSLGVSLVARAFVVKTVE